MSGRVLLRAALLCAGTGLAIMPVTAAPLEFSGSVQGTAGYADNPFLRAGRSGGTPTVGGGIQGSLTDREETSTTTLRGYYNRQQYFRGFGSSDDLGVSLARQERLSTELTGNGRIAYSNTRSAFTDPIDVIDQSSLGSRRKAFDATGSLVYTPTARDSFTLSGFGTHATYSGRGLGDYDTYGGTLRYDRTISDRTTAGASVTLSRTDSKGFGTTDTVQPNINVTQKLSAYWTFDGSIGLIFQKTDFANRTSNSRSLGFDTGLCGKYPRWDLCARASRQTTASGFGGLRTETSASLRYNYTLDSRSRVNLTGIIGETKSEDRAIFAPRQRYASLDAGYSRDLNQRISVGADAGYRYRQFDGTGKANGFTATVNISAKIGRVK